MSEMRDLKEPSQPLSDVRVIDLTDEFGAYAGKLLADFGADVVRVCADGEDPIATIAPLVPTVHGEVSTFERFVNTGKRIWDWRPETPGDLDRFADLVRSADVVIESSTLQLERYWSTAEVAALAAHAVRVVITPFGLADDPVGNGGDGSTGAEPAGPAVDDLLVMAEGGLLHLGGYEDLGPVVAYGGQSRFAASIFGATAAIVGLMARDAEGGRGAVYDVSAQECIAQALEDSAATYSLTGQVRDRLGERPREAGTGVFPAADGYVSMVAGRLGTAKAWTALVQWLADEGAPGVAILQRPEWGEFSFRQSPAAIDEFTRIFTEFSTARTKAELYEHAQARLIALSPVSTVTDLMSNPQLRHRDFFVTVDDPALGRPIGYPRPPFKMSATPPRAPRPAEAPRPTRDDLVAGTPGERRNAS